jgi:predicted RNA binding protein YcfA (HicA-like mRNA interferase family)
VARKRKPSGRLNKGPWSPDYVIRAIEADGWRRVAPPPHSQFEHPNRRGKITVDANWKNGVKASDDVFGFMAAQGDYSKRDFIALMNRV